MSFGGILATALAGGAGVIGKQAGDDIEARRKADMLKQQADIEFQTQQRLAEMRQRLDRDQTLWKTQGEGGTATLDFNRRDIEQRNDLAIKGEVAKARGLIPVTQEAAKASATTATEIAKLQAGDKDYLKSINVLKLADPEVRARIAASTASANASAQQVKESAERLKQLQAVGELTTKVRGLQDTLAKTTDPAQRQAVEQQITDLGFSGKDVKSFLSTAERAMTNGDTAMKVLLDPTADETTKAAARAQLERANEFASKAAGLAGIKLDGAPGGKGAPAAGTEVNGYVFKGGDPNDKANWTPKAGAKPGGMIPGGARAAASDSNDRNIRFVPAGYGTGLYRYAGKDYPTQAAAEAAKAEWDSIKPDDYFKTPN